MSNEVIKVYSVKEVAQILQTTRQQVRKMIQNEELATVKGRQGVEDTSRETGRIFGRYGGFLTNQSPQEQG